MGQLGCRWGARVRSVLAVWALLAGAGLTASAAVPQVQADFTASPVSGAFPLEVQFTGQATGGTPVVWSWDFGDGATSNKKSPLHVYDTPGLYSVRLTVVLASFQQDSEFKADLIDVPDPGLVASFDAAPVAGDLPLVVQFSDTTASHPPTGWHWDFGDGTTSNQQHPEHVYVTLGAHTVTFTAHYFGVSDVVTAVDLVTVAPTDLVPGFSVSTSTGDQPLAVQFSDTTTGALTTAWTWDFGDGAISHEQHPLHVYQTPGVYSVSLDVAFLDQVETLLAPESIVVTPAEFTPDFQAGVTAGVAPLSVPFEDTSTGAPATKVQWTFGDGFSSFEAEPQHLYPVPGTFSVSLKQWVGSVFETTVQAELIEVGPYGGLYAEVATLQADGGDKVDRRPLAAWGALAVEGAPTLDEVVGGGGLVRVFRRDVSAGWQPDGVVVAADSGPYDRFGEALALEGDTLLVGAPWHGDRFDCCDGVVYEFVADGQGGWVERGTVSPGRPIRDGLFGRALDLAGDRLIVGAPGNFFAQYAEVGHAYVFERQPGGVWREAATLSAGNEYGTWFGAAVAVDGDWALVGEPYLDGPLLDVGRAYLFHRDADGEWRLHQQLSPELPAWFTRYGGSVALHGDIALVGAPEALPVPGGTSGLVDVWERGPDDHWRRAASLTPTATPGVTGGHFGATLDLERGRALVGGSVSLGVAHLFVRQPDGSWPRVVSLASDNLLVQNQHSFGRGVALAGEALLVGSWIDTPQGSPVKVRDVLHAYEPLASGQDLSLTGGLRLAAEVDEAGRVTLVVAGARPGEALVLLLAEAASAGPDGRIVEAGFALVADGSGAARVSLDEHPILAAPAMARVVAVGGETPRVSASVTLPAVPADDD